MTKTADQPKVQRLDQKPDEVFIASGTELDSLLGGGFPRGRMVELWGKEAVGKTHLASLLIANISQKHKVLYVDTEYALNKAHVASLGVDVSKVKYVADSRLEAVCEFLVANVGQYDVIVLDSLAMLTPLSVANSEIGERSIGLFALLIKHWVVKFRPLLANSQTAMVVLNQYRPPIGLYATEEPPGGKAFQHACDVRIKLTTNTNDKITKDGKQIGHFVTATVKKSKVSLPHQSAKLKVIY